LSDHSSTAADRVVTTVDELKELIGQEIGVSDWLEITQERVNKFADATGDHQYIHVDPERAKTTFFGGTVAHGYLTLSLIPHLSSTRSGVKVNLGGKMGVNYGLNRVRFTAPVPSGSRVRARFTLKSFERLADSGIQVTWNTVIEREGSDKPVLIAEWLGRHYY
jgi:acyl dehydratase